MKRLMAGLFVLVMVVGVASVALADETSMDDVVAMIVEITKENGKQDMIEMAASFVDAANVLLKEAAASGAETQAAVSQGVGDWAHRESVMDSFLAAEHGVLDSDGTDDAIDTYLAELDPDGEYEHGLDSFLKGYAEAVRGITGERAELDIRFAGSVANLSMSLDRDVGCVLVLGKTDAGAATVGCMVVVPYDALDDSKLAMMAAYYAVMTDSGRVIGWHRYVKEHLDADWDLVRGAVANCIETKADTDLPGGKHYEYEMSDLGYAVLFECKFVS